MCITITGGAGKRNSHREHQYKGKQETFLPKGQKIYCAASKLLHTYNYLDYYPIRILILIAHDNNSIKKLKNKK